MGPFCKVLPTNQHLLALRRLNLIQAVEGDDWSSVIDAQTAETAPAGSPAAAAADAAAAPASPIESPFSRASVHRTIGAMLFTWLLRSSCRRRTAYVTVLQPRKMCRH
jgi:hypothetical protein